MSRIDELIVELCPNGVEYVSIGSLISKVTEKRKNNTSINQVFVVSSTLGLVKAEEYRENTIHSEDTSNYTIVMPNSFAYNPARLNIGSIALNNTAISGLVSPMYVVFSVNEDKILPKYMELILKTRFIIGKINAFKEEGARFRFDFSRWNWINIPLPPIVIQKEIINILSVFTEYNNLLTAELTARKKQYEYYRDLLLDFGVHSGAISECEWRTIKEIAYRVASGKNKEKNQEGAYPVYGSTGIIAYCNHYEYKKKQILIARVGANAGYVHIADGKYDVSDNTLIVDVNDCVLFKYIYYLLVNMNLNRFAKGGGQPLVTAGQIKEISIPIPPIEEQERIVSILDRFDKLCNDISEGLPAEIEARRKQYEYYRDKLLSFNS